MKSLVDPTVPTVPAGQHVAPEILTAHTTWIKGSKEIAGLMLMTMEPDIQRNLETLHAHEMLLELKTLFAQQVEHELLQTTRDFHSCKQEEWQSVNSYALKMKGYINNLERLGHPVTLGLGVILILISLRKEIDGFVQNYNMHSLGKTINELHDMLKLREQTLPKNNAPALHAIRVVLSRVAKEEKERSFGSWWLRKLKSKALSLYMCNGQREAVEAIGVFYLCLPSGLKIVLNNYHYALSITRGVIFVSHLYEDGFINRFVNNTIQVSRNHMVYFRAIPRDGIVEIDLSNSYTNESSIYAVKNKRAKLDLDSALLAFEKYVSCMSRKMARKPYTHQVERAKDLLRLIHTDEVENQLGKTVKSLRSDRWGEYMSQEFLDHLKDHGIISHRTPPYTPQHNGVSERRNRTLLDMVRSMMSQTTLLKSFWDYALETAARILHMIPTKKVEKTPYEVWHGQSPKLSYLKVWGCEALVKRDTLTKPDKLEPRSIKCIFIGYPKETMGYSFYYPLENKVLVAQNAEFLENSLITQEASGSLKDLKIIQEEDMHPSIDTSLYYEKDDQEINEPQSDINPIRRPTRTRHASDLELPPNGKTVGSKWLIKKKTVMDGFVHTYKARLVAKGYTQTPGNEYEKTFSRVIDIRAIRILKAIATYYDYEIWQMNVKTAFLNGYLNEEVYMEQPEESVVSDKECLHDGVKEVDKNVTVNGSKNKESNSECDVDMTDFCMRMEESRSKLMEEPVKSNDDLSKSSEKTYASATKSSSYFETNKLLFLLTEFNEFGDEVVVFDEELVELGSKKWELTLCGHLIGHFTSLPALNYHLRRMWYIFGFKDIVDNEPKLFDVLMKAWTTKGISAISSRVDRPMIMDSMTACVCKNGVGRTKFSRVLVKVDADKGFKEAIELQYKDKQHKEADKEKEINDKLDGIEGFLDDVLEDDSEAAKNLVSNEVNGIGSSILN
nr:hypothetical protein [Tanacetum cinerariifolium]